MNEVDCVVTQVLSGPTYHQDCSPAHWWTVKVEFNSWGTLGVTELDFLDEDEAKEVEVGYKFVA